MERHALPSGQLVDDRADHALQLARHPVADHPHLAVTLPANLWRFGAVDPVIQGGKELLDLPRVPHIGADRWQDLARGKRELRAFVDVLVVVCEQIEGTDLRGRMPAQERVPVCLAEVLRLVDNHRIAGP